MSLKPEGSCRQCGAPIYVDSQALEQNRVPKPKYSCTCPRPNEAAQEHLSHTGKVLLS